jgi:predicted DNA-binding transcriptional regulator YafY
MGMAKYDRLLFILNLLRSRRNLNAVLIARECEVTERTIYRDIISLSEANIPIYYDNGYKLTSENFLPTLNFNLDEYLTLRTALDSSPLNNSGRSRKLIKSILSKVEACLTPDVKQAKKYSSAVTQIDIKSTAASAGSEKLYSIVEEAIKNHRIIKLRYNSIESGEIDRDVEPYFLIFINKAFYFVGYCHLRRDLRTFRTDRIIDAILTDNRFIPRQGIDPARYFENSWGVFSGEPIEVEILFTGRSARIIKLGKHHSGEKVVSIDESKVRYQVTVRGVEEISRWILGFGGEATVIKPLSLAAEICRKADAILINYK